MHMWFLAQFVKVAHINYNSRNQLHCTANLNFGLIMFYFLLNWRKNSNYSKIAGWQSDFMKRNFRGFTFKYETLTNKIEIILSYRVSYDIYVIHICNVNFCGNLMTAADKQRSVG